MVNPSTRANLPTLPRSNRQYVPPLMLAKGRDKSQSLTVPKKVCRSVIEDDNRVSFDPLFTPPPRDAILKDWDSSSDSYGDNKGIQSPLEDEHMNLDQGTENADGNLNDVNEDSENPNGLDLEDINENILENVDVMTWRKLKQIKKCQMDVFCNENM
ncbi:Phosphatidylinositol/phosphatidylcholine transfer protein SFH13 [Bienertia sinuspersici]